MYVPATLVAAAAAVASILGGPQPQPTSLAVPATSVGTATARTAVGWFGAPPFALPAAPAPLASLEEELYGPPPGMVEVPQQRIEVGGDPEQIAELIVKNEAVRGNLAAEVGDGSVMVEAFYLMPYEVTNEQYLRYVLATGARPPQHWAEPAINAASRAYLEETHDDPEAPKFSEKDWWALNWKDAEWSMPTDIATLPVVYVDKRDADGYCKWAGLRLMTEFEFQSAGREKKHQRYTWGDEWERDMAVTSDPDQRARPEEVGSIEDARSEHGVYDLCGNVWEWTSSPYVALPGYEDLDYTVKQGSKKVRKKAVALFERSNFVVVGGSFANTGVAARLSTRRPTSPNEMFSALGFRCAADLRPVAGRARAVVDDMNFDMSSHVTSRSGGFNVNGALGFERWITTEGRLAKPGYAVIDGHEWFAWIPALKLPESSNSGLKSAGKEEPIPFGVFTTTVPLASPALEPGTYMVAWRPEGKPKKKKRTEQKEEKEADDGEVPDVGGPGRLVASPSAPVGAAFVEDEEDPFNGLVDYDKDAWVFYDSEMNVVGSLVVTGDLDDARPSDKNPSGRRLRDPDDPGRDPPRRLRDGQQHDEGLHLPHRPGGRDGHDRSHLAALTIRTESDPTSSLDREEVPHEAC